MTVKTHKTHARVRIVGLIAAMALVVAACGGGSSSATTTSPADGSPADGSSTSSIPDTTTTTVVTTTTTPSTTTTRTSGPIGEFATDTYATADFPRSGDPNYLTDVGLSTLAGFDRLVFQFDGDVSTLSYQIEPLSPPILESPSGLPTDVAGDSFFKITFSPASAYEFANGETVARYTGPDRIQPPSEAAAVAEVVETEDFENVLSWVVGVTGDGSYASALEQSEGRLIVDFSSG